MHERWKRRLAPLLTIAKVGVTVALLALLFTQVDPVRALALWRNIDLGWAALAAALVLPNVYVQYRRWRVGLLRVYPDLLSPDAVRSLLLGLAMGAVTPGRFGELGQVVVLPPGGRRRALGVMGVMRIYAFLATMSLGVVMWAWIPNLVRMAEGPGRATALGVFGAVIVFAVVVERLFRTADHPVLQRLIERIPSAPPVFLGVQALRPTDRLAFYTWSLGLSMVYLSQLVFLMRAFGADVGWAPGMAAGAITIGVVALLPITFGSLGVRESAAVIIWHQLGVASPTALSAAFALYLVNVVLPGALGVVWNAARSRLAQPEPGT